MYCVMLLNSPNPVLGQPTNCHSFPEQLIYDKAVFEPTCAYARWAHMSLSVCPSVCVFWVKPSWQTREIKFLFEHSGPLWSYIIITGPNVVFIKVGFIKRQVGSHQRQVASFKPKCCIYRKLT